MVGRREKEIAGKKRPPPSVSIQVPGLDMRGQVGPVSESAAAPICQMSPSASSNVRYIQLDSLLSPRSSRSLDESSAVPSPRVRRLSMSRKGEDCQINTSVGAAIATLEAEVDDLRHRLRASADQKGSATLSESLVAALRKLSALRATEAETLTRAMSGYMAVAKTRAATRSLSASTDGGSCLEFRAKPSDKTTKFWFSLRDKALIYSDTPEGQTLGRLTIDEDMAVTSIDMNRFTLANNEKAWEFYVDVAEDHREWASALALAVGSGFISTPRRGGVPSTSPRGSGKMISLKSPRATAVTRTLSSPRGSQPSKESPLSPPKRRPVRGRADAGPLQNHLYRSNCDHAHYAALKAKLSTHFQVKIEEKLGLFKCSLGDLCAWIITFSVQPHMENLDFANFLLCRDLVCTAHELSAAFEKAWKLLNTRSASVSLSKKLHFVCRQWLEAPMVAKDVEEELAARNKFRLFCMRIAPDTDAFLAGTSIPPVDERRDSSLPPPLFELESSSEKSGSDVLRVATAEELAEQLTLLTAEEFDSIPTRDYLLYAMNSSGKLPKSLQHAADSFNKISRWVTFSIVSKDTEKSRITEFKRMLNCAEKLHVLRNYHAAAAVLGGLGHTAISRLRKLQAALAGKYTTRLLKLQKIYSPLRNYGSYRSLPKQTPCIPIMAITMKDLLVTSESNPTYCSEEEVAINFTKLQMVGSYLREHQVPRPYVNLHKSLQIAACLLSIDPPSHDHSYSLSVKLEPVTSQQLEMEIQKLKASLAEAEDENKRLRAAAKTHNALVAAAQRLPPSTCSCSHASLLLSHLDAK